MRVLITGANGFIGKNLVVRLAELEDFTLVPFDCEDDVSTLPELVRSCDAVVHLAGENRPADVDDFDRVNAGLTITLIEAIRKNKNSTGRKLPVILASSTQAMLTNPYGRSKLAAEQAVEQFSAESGNPISIFRLPGVFGKWCKPNYNSVVATFCYNLARNLPIEIHNPETQLSLVYIDDVIEAILRELQMPPTVVGWPKVLPEYVTTLANLAAQIRAFNECRTSLLSEPVGEGFARALYATYVSYLPTDQFSYAIPQYADERGVFAEMLKTPNCGQFSFFTAHPGVTRGGHYHHTKTEKFLVVKGKALFRFRHMLYDELVEFTTTADKPTVVDTIPGWAHDITNIGNEEMVVMLWANEVFDRERPDTIVSKVVT